VAVFSGFAMADLPPLKQLGVGLGIAVFLDATVVRGVLVPAAMAVMGRGNWWWPGRRASQALPGTVGVMDTQLATPDVSMTERPPATLTA
jgi:RND superfamily putative drug exporter